jgi:hypothetical protein
MPSKVSIVDKRKWLKQFEEGKQIAYIASKSKKDTRTVKKGIDDARRERDASRAVSDMLSRTLEKHNESLLSVVREIISVLFPLSTNFTVPWKEFNSSLVLPGAKVEYSNSLELKMPKVTLDIESRLEWGLLVEHLKHDPLITGIEQWKKAMGAHIWARVLLEQRISGLLVIRTGYRMPDNSVFQLEGSAKTPFIDPIAVVLLSQFLTEKATNNKAEKLENIIKVNNVSGQLRFGELGPEIACALGQASECREKIIALVNEMFSSQETLNVVKTYKDMMDTTAKASRVAQELLLLDFIPGRCRICHRLGF